MQADFLQEYYVDDSYSRAMQADYLRLRAALYGGMFYALMCQTAGGGWGCETGR